MPASILQSNKVIGGAEQAGPRSFYVSWEAPPGKGGGPAADVADLFAGDLEAYPDDLHNRPIRKPVVRSAPGQQQAGTLVVAGGDSDWTDFIALVSTAYAKANTPPTGEFAQVLRLIDEAGEGGVRERAVWTAVIEPCLWRHFMLGGYRLGLVSFCHWLTGEKEIASSAAARKRDVAKAIEQILTHDPLTCSFCRREP